MKVFLSFVLGFVCSVLMGQIIHPMEELDQKLEQEKRPILIFLQTYWCGICKMQTKRIAQEDKLVQALNSNVYYTEFNAESQTELKFGGEIFKGTTQGFHELVTTLLGNDQEIAFPTWVILSSKYEILGEYSGFLRPNELMAILKELNEGNELFNEQLPF